MHDSLEKRRRASSDFVGPGIPRFTFFTSPYTDANSKKSQGKEEAV